VSQVQSFIDGHLGVGNPGSTIWFIGPEPAGSGTLEDVQARVLSFVKQGSLPITNLKQDLIDLGETKWFVGEKVPTQPYWRRIAHVFMAAHGAPKENLNVEMFRKFQQNVLLGATALGPLMLETSALPAKSTNHWTYSDWDVPGLKSRKEYFNEVIPARMKKINLLIEEHEPKIVLCCGPTYLDRWKYLKHRAGTKMRVIPHPCAKGVTHEQWTKVGEQLAEYL
jgi:hypothetical protein